jgi:predicted ATPase
MSPAIASLGGFETLRFRGLDAKERAISIVLTGQFTQHASDNAPDVYKLKFWNQTYKFGSSSTARQLLRRNEEFLFKRKAGRGRRITLSGTTIKFNQIGEDKKRLPNPLSVQSESTGLATLRRLGEEYEAAQVEALAQVFENLRLFDIDVEKIRRPSRGIWSSRLNADGSNLAQFLRWLKQEHDYAFDRLSEDIRYVLPSFGGFEFQELGGAEQGIQIALRETHISGPIPLARASFGTIRAIALFAMLHDPNPPKLTCIEEIDHGLHPHALDRIVDRLREASTRTQLVLATHSPALVNRLDPSELIVVEKDYEDGASRIIRPKESIISKMIDDTGFGLGELWFSGSLGGGL